MSIEALANIVKEKEIVKELIQILDYYEKADSKEKLVMKSTINSLLEQLKILSDSVSVILEPKEKVKEKREYQRITTARGTVYIDKKLKEEFIKQLGIESRSLERLGKKVKAIEDIEDSDLKKPSFFVSFSSAIFHKLASSLIDQGHFEKVKRDLKKTNMNYLASSYISLTFCVTLFVLVISLAVALGLSSSATMLRNIILALVVSVFAFIFTLNYPSLVASSARNRLDDELPFAIAHVSAIASSQVEPSKIFQIMARIKDYPFFAKEAKKIVSQVNLYGYDLVTALKNVAKSTSSERLSELFLGIATTTKTGGSLVKYLQEKSKDFLVDYRLRRQKYSEVVSMLSDVYTALLIAAPLILMLILAIMSVVGSSFGGMSIPSLATIGLVVIIALNILFIIFIHITQPKN